MKNPDLECPFCGRKIDLYTLAAGINGVEPYECPECGAFFVGGMPDNE